MTKQNTSNAYAKKTHPCCHTLALNFLHLRIDRVAQMSYSRPCPCRSQQGGPRGWLQKPSAVPIAGGDLRAANLRGDYLMPRPVPCVTRAVGFGILIQRHASPRDEWPDRSYDDHCRFSREAMRFGRRRITQMPTTKSRL